jgi:Uma2 family endonuclease
MATILSPPLEAREQRVVLNHVSWETYERLLDEQIDASSPRLTYDQGALEIMTPSSEHEEWKETMAAIADAIAEEWGVEFRRFGSTTFRRRDLERGAEPDACFYLQSVDRIQGKREIDMAVDPPPDLIIEVEITKPALDKLSIYARLGVPEIWRYDGRDVRILQLAGDRYDEKGESGVLPGLTQLALAEFLRQSRVVTTLAWRRMVRDWARSQRK